MAAIITEKFRQHNADQFYESFSEASGNAYYLFIGKSTPYTSGTSGGSDGAPPTPSDSVGEEFYVWDDMIHNPEMLILIQQFELTRYSVIAMSDQK